MEAKAEALFEKLKQILERESGQKVNDFELMEYLVNATEHFHVCHKVIDVDEVQKALNLPFLGVNVVKNEKDKDYLERVSKALKKEGFNIAPEMLNLVITVGEYLHKHPELLTKTKKS